MGVHIGTVPLPSATKPKKRSAFILFVVSRTRDVRSDASLMTKNKEGQDRLDVTKMAKALGAEWKSMSDAEKKVGLRGQGGRGALSSHSVPPCLSLSAAIHR